ncbi:MAG TPA: diguanylate cyclase, partial [Candidatus Baltobacteraceae bacterium]|nr:diguanylate cyclase [Candidatus Baltobacteraceae bacterium]
MAKARAPAAAAPLFEYPWYAIAITLLAAAAVTVLIVRSAGDHAAAVIESARAAESARLRQNVSRGDANATAAIQIEDVAARLFSPVRDRYEVQRDLLRLLRASNAGLVSGVGVFYAPRAFDANHRLNGFYVDRGMLARGATYWLNDGFGFDYPSAPWYRAAVEARGRLVVTRPYFAHGHTFISVVREFFDGANPVGVVIVDALRATIVRNMRVTLARGEVAYITDLGGFVTVASGRIPSGGAFEEQSMAFRSIPWTMHLVADFAGVHAAQRRIWVAAAVEIALVWCLTAAILFGLARLARYKAQTQLLAEHSDALENEIAVRAAVEARLRVTAYRDLLTGLPNRAHILETLQSAIGRGGAPGSFGVFFIDLDQFAVINDSLGHSTGDALLKHIAERIAGNLPPAAVLGRLGGDEFIVYAPLAEPEDAHALARNLLQTLRR